MVKDYIRILNDYGIKDSEQIVCQCLDKAIYNKEMRTRSKLNQFEKDEFNDVNFYRTGIVNRIMKSVGYLMNNEKAEMGLTSDKLKDDLISVRNKKPVSI